MTKSNWFICEDDIRYAALQNDTAAIRDGGLVDLFRFLHADGRIVDALDLALRTLFRSLLMFAPPPQPQSSTLASGAISKLKPPSAAGAVPDIHHWRP